jgi:3-dehydroquinate synthase
MKTITVNTTKQHCITIENGRILKRGLPKGFIISDVNVAKNYPQFKLAERKNAYIVYAGEESKSLKTYSEVIRSLNEFSRAGGEIDRLIALGGGVVGDLTGYVSATYNRGRFGYIQVPTSLLAMVDSSIGGKTGLNFDGIKNNIGITHQPERILIDPLFLQTLPEDEFRNAMGEVVKYHLKFGFPSKEDILKRNIKKIIPECCKIKAEVVAKDEFDTGYRHILNPGHTVAHALELLCGFRHGEAVSIGLVKEMKIARRLKNLNVTKEAIKYAEDLLTQCGLPTEFPIGFKLDDLLDGMVYDKKGAYTFCFDGRHLDVRLDREFVRGALEK